MPRDSSLDSILYREAVASQSPGVRSDSSDRYPGTWMVNQSPTLKGLHPMPGQGSNPFRIGLMAAIVNPRVRCATLGFAIQPRWGRECEIARNGQTSRKELRSCVARMSGNPNAPHPALSPEAGARERIWPPHTALFSRRWARERFRFSDFLYDLRMLVYAALRIGSVLGLSGRTEGCSS